MKDRLLFCGLVLALIGGTLLAAPARNVILFVVDDQGLEGLGCYGNPAIKTPNIDRLATEGTRFKNAFCTAASCSASRAVILTGLHSHANGQYGHQQTIHNFHTFTSVRSLPVLLAEAGYRTASIGKLHIQPQSVYQFQTYLRGNQGGARNPVSMAEHCREFITDKSAPFFLYFCPADPHRGGGTLDKPHQPNAFGNNLQYDGVTEVTYDPKDLIVPPFLPDTPTCRAELAEYYQSNSRIDQGLGRLIDLLKETGQYENTLIVYTSDNGIAFPGAKTTLYDPGLRLPLIVRSPDQRQRGIVSDAMVSWADFTPTILDFAGVKEVTGALVAAPPSEPKDAQRPVKPRPAQRYTFHGRSFLGILDQAKPQGWDEIYASQTFHGILQYYPMRVIQTRQYKLLLNIAHQLPFPFASDLYDSATWQDTLTQGASVYGQRRIADLVHRPRYELYDTTADAHEVANLVENPNYAQVLAELQAKLRAFQERTGDPWVVKYHYD